MRMHLRKHLKHAHRLLLIDDVQHVDEAERLMQAHPGRSATIITTPHHTVAQKLARSKDLLLDISGFSPDETWQLYSFFCNAEVPATLRKVVTALTDLLQGNPLALQMAFFLTNAIGWEDTLTQLRHPTPETVAELESTVYLPMRLVYKLLPPAYQRSFRMLGG
ncbi:MAG: hypothetical protein GY792_31200, partial [Gammaproteobacteria bacterium]|nr:hypothetical protein [Gammaproteobacteria bacterium]